MEGAGLSRGVFEDFVRDVVAETGPLVRDFFADPSLAVETKSDESPVTRADREAELLIRERIRRRFPEHGIVGEEHGAENEGADLVWLVDPIDGTRSFVAGCPLFGTLLGVLHEGRSLFGALHVPVTGQLLLGDGQTTTLDGRPVRVRETERLEDALLLATNVRDVPRHQPGPGWWRVVGEARSVRTWGDCFGYLLVCAGFADVMVDAVLPKPWDRLPLLPLLRGAGATVTTWDGGDPETGDSLVAAAPGVHGRVLELLAARD